MFSQNATVMDSRTGVSLTKTCTIGPDTADIVWIALGIGTVPTANDAVKTITSGKETRTVHRASATKSVSVFTIYFLCSLIIFLPGLTTASRVMELAMQCRRKLSVPSWGHRRKMRPMRRESFRFWTDRMQTLRL